MKKIGPCSTEVGAGGLSHATSQSIPPNASSNIRDEVNFQFIIYYYETPYEQAL